MTKQRQLSQGRAGLIFFLLSLPYNLWGETTPDSSVYPQGHPSRKSAATTVAVDMQNEQKNQSFQLYSQTLRGDISSISAGVSSEKKSKFTPFHADFYLKGRLALESYTFEQLDPNLVEDDLTDLKTAAIAPVKESGQIGLMAALVSSGLDWKLSNESTAGFNLDYTTIMPDLKINRRAHQPALFGKYQLESDAWQLKLSSGVLQTRDQPYGLQKTEIRATVFTAYELTDDLIASAGVKLAQYSYNDPAANGPKEHITATCGIAASFPLHIKIGANFTAIHNYNFRLHDLPSYAEVTFAENGSQETLFVAMAPLSWLSGELHSTVIARSFTSLNIADAVASNELREARPHDIGEFQVLIKAGYTF